MDASLMILSALLISASGAPSGVFREAQLQPIPSRIVLPTLISPTARLVSPAGSTSNAAVFVIPIQSEAEQHLIGYLQSNNPSKHLLPQSGSPETHSLLRLSPLSPSALTTSVQAQTPEVFLLASPANAELLPITSATGLRITNQIAPAPLAHSVGLEPTASFRSSGILIDGKSVTPPTHSSFPIAALSQQQQASEFFPQLTNPHQQRSVPVPNYSVGPIQGQLTGNLPANPEVKSSIQPISSSNLGQQIQPIISVSQKQIPAPEAPLQNQNLAKNQVSPAGSPSELVQHSLNPSPILNAPSTPLNPEENSGRSQTADTIQASAPVPQESVGNVIPNPPGVSSVEPSNSAKQSLGNNEQISPNPSSNPNI